MRLFWYLFATFCLTSILHAQVPKPPQSATIHFYRTGRTSLAFQICIDGQKAFKINDHKEVTFYAASGYHEFTVKFGNRTPTASLMAKADQEYFSQLDYEASMTRAMLGSGPEAVSVSISREDGIAEPEKIKDVED